MKKTCAFVIGILFSGGVFSQTVLLDYQSTGWKYLDSNLNLGTSWVSSGYSETGWKTGQAPFGYGVSPAPATTLRYGSNAKKKFITSYFRKTFSITSLSNYGSVRLSLQRDDGAAVYVNGNRAYVSNLPSSFTYTTKASSEISPSTTAVVVTLADTFFREGTNLITIELHQFSASGPDVVLDCKLEGMLNQAPTANAGADQTITLPSSSVTLTGSGSDPEGRPLTYLWTKVSGPATGTIASPTSSSTAVSNLSIAGSYVFQLSVTDNKGAVTSDQVSITVNEAPASSTLTLIGWGSTWKYQDSGLNLGTTWSASAFNDASWLSGPAQLGYGDGDEATVVYYGTDPNAKYTTTYFRKTINFSNPAAYAGVTLNVKRDDGIIVYVNGVERYRDNMPAGTVTYTTLASAAAADDGNNIFTTQIPISAFTAGSNTLAVEIHQNAGNSSDISFDLELIAKDASSLASLSRGPYWQMVSGTAATLRWRTDVATNSRVEIGTQFGTYTQTFSDATSTTEHEIRITGLSADTRYFYRFGNSSRFLQEASDNFIVTAPPAATNRKVRVAVFGDCGRNDNSYQNLTLSAYLNYVSGNPAELMLLLGDNAYNSGTDAEYQSNFFNIYSGSVLKNHALFPAPGNHDYANTAARQADKNVPYYANFTLPAAAQCGGVASNTECYYSYDWGNIHFLSLDSYGTETANALRLYDTTGPQVTWIKQDLAANTRKWTIAYWHHPPYTMGSHNSDTETELVKMRENFIRILENAGVDMILCGHSHDYERSYLLKNYYANESSFSLPLHAVNSSSGKYDNSANSCAYVTQGGKINHGTVYVVSGSAGASGGVQAGYPHNALPFAINDGGMFYFEVDDNRLDAKFIRKDGVLYDQFTLMKDAGVTQTVNATAGQPVTLTASWKGTYQWSTGATTRSITVSPLVSTQYTCSDGLSCLTDQFNVNVSPGALSKPVAALAENQGRGFTVYPIPVRRGQPLHIDAGSTKMMRVELVSATGQLLSRKSLIGNAELSTQGLRPGLYFLRCTEGQQTFSKRIVISE